MRSLFGLTIFFIAFIPTVFSQKSFPYFMEGTWKQESGESYEHWDRVNDGNLKGFVYELKNGQPIVSEYVSITLSGKDIVYTATVLNQNEGKGVDFKLTQTDNTYSFENPKHDFPRKIVYKRLNDNELLVKVSGEKQKGFSYKLIMQNVAVKDSTIVNPDYDNVLAEQLGADNYGMKGYVLAVLKTGSNVTENKDNVNKAFRGHLDNITRLVKEGKMIVAGPLGKNDKTYRGIFILNVTTKEEATKLLETDPAIKEQLLEAELYEWYGSAALPEYLKTADKIWKQKP